MDYAGHTFTIQLQLLFRHYIRMDYVKVIDITKYKTRV